MTANLLHTFGQTYYYNYSTSSSMSGTHDTAFWVGYFTGIGLLVLAIMISNWRLFTKAGEKGWKAIIPVYSTYITLKIIRRPGWWLILFFIPLVNIVLGIVVALDLAKAFGRGVGLAILCILLPIIGYPILAFGKSTYQLGDEGQNPSNPQPPVMPSMTPPTPPVQS